MSQSRHKRSNNTKKKKSNGFKQSLTTTKNVSSNCQSDQVLQSVKELEQENKINVIKEFYENQLIFKDKINEDLENNVKKLFEILDTNKRIKQEMEKNFKEQIDLLEQKHKKECEKILNQEKLKTEIWKRKFNNVVSIVKKQSTLVTSD